MLFILALASFIASSSAQLVSFSLAASDSEYAQCASINTLQSDAISTEGRPNLGPLGCASPATVFTRGFNDTLRIRDRYMGL